LNPATTHANKKCVKACMKNGKENMGIEAVKTKMFATFKQFFCFM
jgi:hypothetical protein